MKIFKFLPLALLIFFFYPCSHAQDYRLGAGDILNITVYREDELNRQVKISSDGYISFPLLDKVKAGGLTVSELEKNLTEGLREYLKRPQVTVFIKEYNSTITVSGQVKKPGVYTMKGELTAIEAISLAGGFTEEAAKNDVKIMRIENGNKKTIVVKIEDISKTGDASKDIGLVRNDIIFVPEEYKTVTITGQVKKPGSYPLKGRLTVIEAIGLAGGFTNVAAQNNVKIMRMEKGKKKTIRVRIADINKTGDTSQDVALKRGDIVFVPESLF